MPPNLNIDIFINPAGTQTGDYLVELREAGKSLAQVPTRIDREVLLLHEYGRAPDYGMELHDAVFPGKVGREYQRLVGRAGTETSVRVQLVISEYAAGAARAALGAALSCLRRHGRTPGGLGADALFPLPDHRLRRPAARTRQDRAPAGGHRQPGEPASRV